MRSFIIGVVSLFSVFHVHASTIVWNQAFIDDSDPNYIVLGHFAYDDNRVGFAWFGFRIYIDDAYDYTYDYINGTLSGVVITPDSNGGLAYAVNLKEMQVGDTVSEETVRGNQYYFYSNWIDAEPGYDGGSPETSSVYIPIGGEVYLGFLSENAPGYSYYGWLSLIFDGTNVRVGQSAVESTGAPIVILPRQIPEPGTLSLFLVGIAGLMLKRRHLDWRDR
jgi:hypothetical protein